METEANNQTAIVAGKAAEETMVDIPIIFPLLSVTLKTTQIIEGNERPIYSECEEIINLNHAGGKKQVVRLVREFREYLRKVKDEATSPQGRAALQNILDTHSQGQSPTPASPPLMPGSLEGLRQRTLPSSPPAPLPDKASL